MQNTFISFIGFSDNLDENGTSESPVVNAVKSSQYQNAVFFYTDDVKCSNELKHNAESIKKYLLSNNYLENIQIKAIRISDINNPSKLMVQLSGIIESLGLSKRSSCTVCLTPGTKSMSFAWIGLKLHRYPELRLLSLAHPESSADNYYEITLFNRAAVFKNNSAAYITDKPKLVVDTKHRSVEIEGAKVKLSPMEFCYYLFFIRKVIDNEPAINVQGIFVRYTIVQAIHDLHREYFYELELDRRYLKEILDNKNEMMASVFRSILSKIKAKIIRALGNRETAEKYFITGFGIRGAKHYALSLQSENILII